MITIELFPANKTCEQGCSTCPMAKKDNIVTASEINPEVQKTFSILEHMLKKNKTAYDLHFPSSFHLFPKLRYPEMINMSRFATDKEIYANDNAYHFSENVRILLRDNRIKPKVLAFSIVPHLLIVSQDEIDILNEIVKNFMNWHFKKSTEREIDITVRNNLIKISVFNKIIPKVFEADFVHLKGFIESNSDFTGYHMLMNSDIGHMYNNVYSGKVFSNKISIGHRVIASTEVKTIEEHTKQAFWFSANKKGDSSSFAIAPKGVMLEHSSLSINNPVLWLNHEDFRETLEKEFSKSDFSFGNFSEEIIFINASMYTSARRRFEKKGARIKNDDFMTIFKEWRPDFIKNYQKSKKSTKKR